MVVPNVIVGDIVHSEVQRRWHRGVVGRRVLVDRLRGVVVECDREMHAIFEEVLDQGFDYCVSAVGF